MLYAKCGNHDNLRYCTTTIITTRYNTLPDEIVLHEFRILVHPRFHAGILGIVAWLIAAEAAAAADIVCIQFGRRRLRIVMQMMVMVRMVVMVLVRLIGVVTVRRRRLL